MGCVFTGLQVKMLEKITVLNKIEILEDGHIQLRYATRILEDGKPISADTYHREAYGPGVDLPETMSTLVVELSKIVWTPKVVATYRLRLADASIIRV